jgi:glutathione S-transferase
MLTIHNFARGARGLRVMWQCEEMGLPYQVKAVSFPPSAEHRALYPHGSVPFLEDDACGVAIGESIAILLYLASRYGPTPLLPPRDAPLLARVLQMTETGEAMLGAALNPLLDARFLAPEADKDNWSVRSQRARVGRALDYLAGMLAEHEFLAGTGLTLADISVLPALGLCQALSLTLPASLDAYHAHLSTRPAYQRAQLRCHGKPPARGPSAATP